MARGDAPSPRRVTRRRSVSEDSLVRGRPATVFAMRPPLPLALEAAALRGRGRALARSPAAAAARRCPGSCSGSSIRARSTALARTAAARRRSLVSATNGKTTTAAMVARDPRPRVRLAHNALGREPRLGRRLHPARARATPSSACSRSTRRRCPRSRAASGRGRCCSATSSATSSTATASSSSSPRAGATPSPRCPTTRARRQRRRPAGRRPRARARAARASSALDDPRHARPALQHAADSKYCLRCGTPYDYAAAYVGHLGDYRCPNCGHARPPLDVVAREIELHGLDGASFTLVDARGRRARRAARCPGLYNVYNALAAAALALRARRAARRRSSPGCERFAAAFGRFERIAIGDRRLLMLLIKNPAGANEAVRTLVDGARAARRGRRAERRDRRRPRRLVDLGRRLRAAARRARPRSSRPASRAAELALRFAYGGLAARADRGRPVARARRSTAGSS